MLGQFSQQPSPTRAQVHATDSDRYMVPMLLQRVSQPPMHIIPPPHAPKTGQSAPTKWKRTNVFHAPTESPACR